MPTVDSLRVAWLVYRGNPHCGGQGVYTRYLARELTELGHSVTVFSGPPYPDLVHSEQLVQVPSLDLYREPDPFRIPRLHELRDRIDAAEVAIMCSGGFPEPYTFSLRARRLLAGRRPDFDVVHDNQCLGTGLLDLLDDGWPLLTTVHHPITIDRELDLAHASSHWQRLTLRRWYGFLGMQQRVARRMPRVITVSESSRRDLVTHMGLAADRLHVVPVGVDPALFHPLPDVRRQPGRLMTTASADVPMKGLVQLLEALAKLRTERDDLELVVIGRPRDGSAIPGAIDRLGLAGTVRFVSEVTPEEIVALYAEAEIAVVPSLYEGFSLPAVEAMACGVPVVATTGGALPEVLGPDGGAARLVPPNDAEALAGGLRRLLDDEALRVQLGTRGRARASERFTWRMTALRTVEQYRALLDSRAPTRRPTAC